MRALSLLTVFLAGCAWNSPIVGYFQTSDEWHQPGAWDALPAEGTRGGYDIEKVFFGASVHDQIFQATDLDQAWGPGVYRLQFVRWDDHGPDATFRTIQFEPDYVQVWLGVELGKEDARTLFMDVAPQILGADDAERQRLADRLVASERMFSARPATEDATVRPPMKAYGFATDNRPLFEEAYASLGGLAALEAETTIDATGRLPVPGQITLRHEEWEFHMDAALKRATAGDDRDGDLLWIAPTDVVQYVHRDRHDIPDAEATKHLEDTLKALGLAVPERTWAFAHEPIERDLGD